MPSSPDPSFVVFDFGGVLITPTTTLLTEIAGWHDVLMHVVLEVLMGPARHRRSTVGGTAVSATSAALADDLGRDQPSAG